MGIIDILLIILIIVVIFLCLYIFASLKKLNSSLDILENEVNSLKEKVYPLLDNINEIAKRADKITAKAENYIELIEEQFSSAKNKLEKFKDFSSRNKPENRIQELYKNLTAIKKGVFAFWEKFSQK